jgi:hypothetical protein
VLLLINQIFQSSIYIERSRLIIVRQRIYFPQNGPRMSVGLYLQAYEIMSQCLENKKRLGLKQCYILSLSRKYIEDKILIIYS